MALTLGRRIGVYEITAPIGEGGMGQVYRATDTTLGRQVAIKILPDAFASDPERLARFEREAKTLASLNHPHIAAIYGFEKSAGMHALVMELVEGEDLSQRIGRGAIPLDEALPIAKQIADALEAAHEQGIIHRDLKPANIKVRSDGTVKVLDFGLAKAMEPAAGSSPSVSMSPTITTPAMTQAGMILGTAAYMSPEQAKGRTVDKRSDVWSFGAVLYEMLTGRRAFEAEDVSETLAAVLMKEPDWAALPGNTPWNTRRLLRRCCEKDPRRRMRDMGDVALELVDVAPEPFGEAEERRGIRWQMAGPVVLLLLLFAYLGGTWRSTPSTGATTEWIGERLGGPTVAGFPVLSPDNTLLAFTVMDRGLGQIGVMQPGGTGGSRQLTHDRTRGYAGVSAWAADSSSRIYFDRTSRDGTNIYSISAVGDDEERLVLEDATNPRPLADGSLLAVRTNSERLPQLIRFRPTINKLETLPVLLVDTLLDQAIKVLSGARKVLVAGRPQGTPASENHLYLVDPDTGDMRRIAPDLALPRFDWEFPLAATEDEVYFSVPAGDLHRIVAVKLDGSPGVRTVVALSKRPLGIDVARDGTLYLDQIDQPTEILRIDAGTSNVEHFPLSAVFDYVLPLPNDTFLVALGGSRPRLLRVTPPGAPTSFLDTDEETRGPLALIGDRGDSLVAFAIGPAPDQQVALASLDGRLQRRIPISNKGEVTGLAASPDGTSLYYAVDNVVYRIPVVGGESTPISRGQAVAVDPSTGHLVILRRGNVAELIRVPAAGGTETSLAVTGDWRVIGGGGGGNLMGNAIAADGRLVIRTLPPASVMWPTGILDGRTGGQVMPFLDPLDTDMMAAVWDRAGRVVALARPFRSELWSFRPMSAQ